MPGNRDTRIQRIGIQRMQLADLCRFTHFQIYVIEKTRHSYIYVPDSRPNGWTDSTEIFVDTHGWPGGVIG